ncbi:MAG: tetratricopeptide repeat protein [Nitrosospira sp.]
MKNTFLLTIALIIPAFGVKAHAPTPGVATKTQELSLGTVIFPTSAESEKAQASFLRGVAALHSFSYDLALEAFRQSTKIEPDFMMGYWGEAMAYNRSLWGQQDTEAARKVLARIKDTPRLTPKERAYLHAVKILYGEGDKAIRDKAYAAAMEEIHREHPDDLEAASFSVIALLGSIRSDDPAGLRTRIRAGAIALEVARKKSDHPGAVHYILHAFDDPDHAVLALPAARRYAEIAPGAPHALHMPSHVFLQLGMWPESASTLEQAWEHEKDLPVGKRDYHSLYWLNYVYLQQGRYSKAEELLTLMQKSLAESPKDDSSFLGYATFIHSSMAAAFIVETARWDLATKLIDPLQQDTAKFIDAIEGSPGPYQGLAKYIKTLWIFTHGMAAAQKGSPDARKSIDALQAMEQRAGTGDLPSVGLPLSKVLEIQGLEIAGVASASQGKLDEAIKRMEKATAVEESVPPLPGPPPLIKPSHELFGEILLQADRPAEAEKQFETALLRHTNRARSLLGAARAAARQEDREGAISAYSQFVHQWQQSDGGPELLEARNYLKQANAPQE